MLGYAKQFKDKIHAQGREEGREENVSGLVKDIKVNSTRFINQKRWTVGHFTWQEGFGAFSYSHSQIPEVAAYIENQEKHHLKKTFPEEYLAFLKHFGIAYDVKYVFDPVADLSAKE